MVRLETRRTRGAAFDITLTGESASELTGV
jgi:hypothetical protein